MRSSARSGTGREQYNAYKSIPYGYGGGLADICVEDSLRGGIRDSRRKTTGLRNPFEHQFDYIDQDIGFMSYLSTPEDQFLNKAPKQQNYLLEVDRPLVVPIGKKIRFLVTASDVIHSWWVPQLGVKKDAIPGFINETWTKIDKPGTYRGQCAELCGARHGYMPIVVEAKSEADYLVWLNEQKQAKIGLTHDMTAS
jgi:cytochrome c oxidase subunit 2